MQEIIMEIPSKETVFYPIKIGSHLLENPEEWLPRDFQDKKLIIVTDNNVMTLYGEKLFHSLQKYNALLFSFQPGEKSKNDNTKKYLEDQMISNYCNRETVILSLGGGVVGDLSGFVASTYMRGIPYIQIPTTLLAMVDSSIGGKTSINTHQAKNIIGTFWQPSSVVIDMNCLLTLPKVQMINGFIEALKIFIINDIESFQYAVNNMNAIFDRDLFPLENIIFKAIENKMAFVTMDEREKNRRTLLNFGHTIGHALEYLSDYTLLHGYAVALGMLVEAKISQLLGFLSSSDYHIIYSLFSKLDICVEVLKDMQPNDIIQTTKYDKKNKLNNVRYVLLKKLGEVCTYDNQFSHAVPDDVVKNALIEVGEM